MPFSLIFSQLMISAFLCLLTTCLCASLPQDRTSGTPGDCSEHRNADDTDILAISFELQSHFGHLIAVNTTKGKISNVFASHQFRPTSEAIPTVDTSVITSEANATVKAAAMSAVSGGDPKIEDEVCDATDMNAGDISGKSLCPWRMVVDINENRIPSKIMSVECKCNGKCVSIDNPASCQRVPYTIPALWYNSTSQSWYRGETQVATACVCAL